MEKIRNLITTIQDHIEHNTVTKKVINQVNSDIKTLIEEISPELFEQKERLLEDLAYLFKKKEFKILNRLRIDDLARNLLHFEHFLTALLQDYQHKAFIEREKVTNMIDSTLLKCFEVMGKLFINYLYMWSCNRHYIHRNEFEMILRLLDHHQILLNEKLDIFFKFEEISKYNVENKPDSYTIELNEFEIRIFMSADKIGSIFMDYSDHYRFFDFLNSIKHKLPERKKYKIYQKIENKYPELYSQLIKQLNNLNFRELSPSGELWLKIIGKLFGLLRISAKDKGILRDQAQGWKSEEKDMSPWTNQWLEEKFGKKHIIRPQISDGHSDHFIDDIALEDKLIRSVENLNNDSLIEQKYQKEKRQEKREGILTGFQILILVDVRDEIKEGKIDAKRIPECFKIFYEEGFWTAVFLFQAFTGTPSYIKKR